MSLSSRYVNRPSVSTSALVAPVSASLRKSSAGAGVGQVDGRPGQSAARCLVGQQLGFSPRATAADRPPPTEIGRKVQTIGPGVQAGGQVQHAVAAVGDRLRNDVVDDLGARDQPPPVAADARRLGADGAAMFAGEASGERVAEQRIRTCGFGCAMHRGPFAPCRGRPSTCLLVQEGPAGGVGNVADVPSACHTLRYSTGAVPHVSGCQTGSSSSGARSFSGW